MGINIEARRCACSHLIFNVSNVLSVVIHSLDPSHDDYSAMAKSILEAQVAYVKESIDVQTAFREEIASKQVATYSRNVL